MKRAYFAVGAAIIAIGAIVSSFQNNGVYGIYNAERFHKLNTSGASAGNAGAPGEGSCTNCHSGSVQSGENFNILSFGDGITQYTLGETYTLQLTMTDASSKNGFQLVPLTATGNAAAGTISATDATRTQLLNGQAGKQYLGHRTAGTTVDNWTFNWTAPTTNVGNVVFYVATNKSNGNNQNSGDLIRLSQHVFTAPESSASLTPHEAIKNSLSIGYQNANRNVQIVFNSLEKEELSVNITNLSGQSVIAQSLGSSYPGENEKNIKLDSKIPAGLYVVNFFVGNKAYSEKILVEK